MQSLVTGTRLEGRLAPATARPATPLGRRDVRSPSARAASHARDARLLGESEHAGGLVLDALELADDAAELLTHPGVVGRGRGGPVGRDLRPRPRTASPRCRAHAANRGRALAVGQLETVDGDLGVATHDVVARQSGDVEAVALDHHERELTGSVRRQQEQVADLAAEDVAGRSATGSRCRRRGPASANRAAAQRLRTGCRRPVRPARAVRPASCRTVDTTTTVGRNGPGTIERPSSSVTMASSTSP